VAHSAQKETVFSAIRPESGGFTVLSEGRRRAISDRRPSLQLLAVPISPRAGDRLVALADNEKRRRT